jgi:hypothetical protein
MTRLLTHFSSFFFYFSFSSSQNTLVCILPFDPETAIHNCKASQYNYYLTL